MEESCSKIDQLQEKDDNFGLHKKIKETFNIWINHHTTRIRNERNKYIVTEEEIIAKLSKEYFR